MNQTIVPFLEVIKGTNPTAIVQYSYKLMLSYKGKMLFALYIRRDVDFLIVLVLIQVIGGLIVGILLKVSIVVIQSLIKIIKKRIKNRKIMLNKLARMGRGGNEIGDYEIGDKTYWSSVLESLELLESTIRTKLNRVETPLDASNLLNTCLDDKVGIFEVIDPNLRRILLTRFKSVNLKKRAYLVITRGLALTLTHYIINQSDFFISKTNFLNFHLAITPMTLTTLIKGKGLLILSSLIGVPISAILIRSIAVGSMMTFGSATLLGIVLMIMGLMNRDHCSFYFMPTERHHDKYVLERSRHNGINSNNPKLYIDTTKNQNTQHILAESTEKPVCFFDSEMPKVPFKAPKTKTKTRKREKVMNFFKNIWQNRKSKKNIEKDADKPKFFKYCASPLESLSNEDYLNNPKKFKILMQRNDYKTFRQLVKNNNLNQIKPRSTGSWESSLFNPTVRPSLTKIGRQTISEKAASTGNKIILVDEAKKTQVFEFLEKYKPSKEAFKDAELGNISPLFSGSKSIQSLEKEVMSKEPKDNYVPLERRTNTLNKLVQNDKLDEESAAETTQSYNYNSNSKVDRVRVIDENLET